MSKEAFTFSATAVELAGEPKFDDWLAKLKGVTMVAKFYQFWIGDLLAIGEERFAEKADLVMNDLGLEYQSLANMKWVSKKVAPERRRPELSWQHHLYVAKMGPADQERWLKRAVEKKMSSATLKHAIKLQGGAGPRRLVGPPIDFRGLRYAPINEAGVVYLFGMVSRELGFLIESVQGPFPDCEGKRRVDPRGDKWLSVRIEFEYKSKNFLLHGHDANQCDVIVCWINDWGKDSPVEVIELKSLIKNKKLLPPWPVGTTS